MSDSFFGIILEAEKINTNEKKDEERKKFRVN